MASPKDATSARDLALAITRFIATRLTSFS